MAESSYFSTDIFEYGMKALGVEAGGPIGMAVSGGPDSMALCWLVARWAAERGVQVHAITVDHGLRAESGDEAARVGQWLQDWPLVRHHILRWDAPAESAIQEAARKARYSLMAAYCREHEISQLLLAHHRDDQAETVLFRLAKGSGLDGLAGMQGRQAYDEDLTLVRPLLGVSKDELLALCADEDIPYLEDPSNANSDFARVRLRQARGVLEEEGLSAKRLAVTAQRLGRARKALEALSEQAYRDALSGFDARRIVFKSDVLLKQPEEILLRCLLQALAALRPEADYAPRMERLEAILYDLISYQNETGGFRKRTLGGVVFALDEKDGHLELALEHSE